VSHAATNSAPAAATAPASTGPAPTTPGTYQFSGSGSTTIETSKGSSSFPAATKTTLTVSGGGSTEQWANSVTTLNLSFTSSGVFLTSETLQAAASTPCVFSSPVAYPPWPLAVGKSSSGTASCSGTTLSLVVQVVGQSASNYVVKITQNLAGSLTVVETDTYSPSLRMPVKTSFSVSGSLDGSALSTTSTYSLVG
jgi:hypothetical protein